MKSLLSIRRQGVPGARSSEKVENGDGEWRGSL